MSNIPMSDLFRYRQSRTCTFILSHKGKTIYLDKEDNKILHPISYYKLFGTVNKQLTIVQIVTQYTTKVQEAAG